MSIILTSVILGIQLKHEILGENPWDNSARNLRAHGRISDLFCFRPGKRDERLWERHGNRGDVPFHVDIGAGGSEYLVRHEDFRSCGPAVFCGGVYIPRFFRR